MRGSRSRRQVLLGAGASVAALALARPAAAQLSPPAADPLRRLLGTALPPELRALIPGEVTEAADLVTLLMGLEDEASRIRLPASPLSVAEVPLPRDLDGLYELALPRVVALIDRAGQRDPGFADRAGSLLARLHRTEHTEPEQFRLPAVAGNIGSGPRLGLSDDPGASVSLPPIGEILLPPPPAPDETGSGVLQLPSAPVEPPVASPVPVPSRSLKFADLASEYQAMFAAAQLRPEHREAADWHLTMLRTSRSRYDSVSKRTSVPWYFIGAIHGLEASFNFRAHLHNGDYPLSQRTRQVPAGRPTVWLPPSDWESSAADALKIMGFSGADDWTLARTLYRLEAFNGFGYRRIGRATPYLWSFSTLYDRGKFVADGRFSATARSQQCGTAIMLKLLSDAGDIAIT